MLPVCWQRHLVCWHVLSVCWHGRLVCWHGRLVCWHGLLICWHEPLVSWNLLSACWQTSLSAGTCRLSDGTCCPSAFPGRGCPSAGTCRPSAGTRRAALTAHTSLYYEALMPLLIMENRKAYKSIVCFSNIAAIKCKILLLNANTFHVMNDSCIKFIPL